MVPGCNSVFDCQVLDGRRTLLHLAATKGAQNMKDVCQLLVDPEGPQPNRDIPLTLTYAPWCHASVRRLNARMLVK